MTAIFALPLAAEVLAVRAAILLVGWNGLTIGASVALVATWIATWTIQLTSWRESVQQTRQVAQTTLLPCALPPVHGGQGALQDGYALQPPGGGQTQ